MVEHRQGRRAGRSQWLRINASGPRAPASGYRLKSTSGMELQSDEMGEFWAGLLLGFLFGVIGNILANHYQDLRAQFRAHAKAKRLVGTWRAYNMHGRLVDSTPMEGAGLTVILAKAHWWSAESNVLDVSSQDSSDGRHHSGSLVIDPVCSRLATRILIYDAPTPDEVVEQRIIISHDSKTLYVSYVLATFGLPAYRPAHVLCKVEGSDIMVNRRGQHPHMAFAGMFALGIFVGGLVTLAFRYAPTSVDTFLKMIGAVLTVCPQRGCCCVNG
jgi:hypothetical protein